MMRTIAVVAAFVALAQLWLAGTPALAQVVRTSLLEGRVLDETGGVIQQAEVVLRGPFLLDGERPTLTDDRGRYRFPALLPGTYLITAQARGFAAVERRDILVEVGAGRAIDFVLPVAPTTAEVTVAGRVPSVDVRSAAISSYLDQNLLANLPVTRDISDLINLTPGVTFDVGFGGTELSNAIYINGVQTTDPQDQQPLIGINHNWLEQMEVVALGASAEYGGFTGVAANGIVKSGGNRFSGLAEYWTTRSGWDGDNSPEEPREIVSLWETNGHVGGPIARDRLWYFAGVELGRVEDIPALYSGPGTTTSDRRSVIARLDAALTAAAHLDALYDFSDADSTGVGLGPFVALEATSNSLNRHHLWNTRVSWSVGRQTLIEGRAGGLARDFSRDPRPPNTRGGPPGLRDGSFVSVNAVSFSDADRSRIDAAISMTRYQEIAGQMHDLKAGLEFEATSLTSRSGFPGGMHFVQQRLFRIANVWAGGTSEATSRRGTLYLRDRWSPWEPVTLDLGIRLDLNRASVPERGQIFSTNPISPRVGVAWAATQDHSTVVRAHYGRYHDTVFTGPIAALDTTDQNVRIIAVERPTCGPFPVIDDRGFADGALCEAVRFPPAAVNTTIDGNIRHSYVDQFVVGLEREVAPLLTLQVQYVRRHFEQFMGSIDTNTIWIPQEAIDPGPDGDVGTNDDGGPVVIFRPSNDDEDRRFLYTNPEGANRRYDAVQLIGTKRFSQGWQLEASYTWSRSRATVGNSAGVNAGRGDLSSSRGGLDPTVFANPNGAINAEGTTRFDMSELKVLGTYRVPAWGGFNISGVFRHHSGLTWERWFLTPEFFPVRAEPRGSRRLPAIASLDLRLEKTFSGLGVPGSLGLFVDALNVTNEGVALLVDPTSGPSFGEPITWTDPRTVRAGIRYAF